MGISMPTCCAAAHTSVPGGTATGMPSIVRCTSPSFFSSAILFYFLHLVSGEHRCERWDISTCINFPDWYRESHACEWNHLFSRVLSIFPCMGTHSTIDFNLLMM